MYSTSKINSITTFPSMGMACPFATKGDFSSGMTVDSWISTISVNVLQLIMEHVQPVSMRN